MNKTKYIGYRPTWAEINLANLEYNFKQVKKLLAPETKIMVTVKADAYGHGLIPVAKRLVLCEVDYLGVASIDEGIHLRQAGINLPILVLGLILPKDALPLFNYRLMPTVCERALVLALNKIALKRRQLLKVHIKVDTGMGRIGVLPAAAGRLVREIHRLNFLNIEGIFTHFPLADLDEDFTAHQIQAFNRLIFQLRKEGIHIPFAHAANSMGVIGYQESHFNLVRPGLVIYGLYPKPDLKIRLKPVLSLKTKAVYVKKVPAGYGISYGHDYVTKKRATIVTLPIGYGDGYPRNLSNKAPVLIKGKRLKISGRVCMDQIMVDAGNLAVKIGQEAVLIGRQGRQKITVEELAALSGTIPYEIVCGLGSRIPRIYI